MTVTCIKFIAVKTIHGKTFADKQQIAKTAKVLSLEYYDYASLLKLGQNQC